MEVPRLGDELELQLPAYTTATATPDPSCVCDLYCCGNCKNRGSGRRQTALGDMEKQGLFSTGAGSEESPPESEHQVFVLSNFYTLQGLDFPM